MYRLLSFGQSGAWPPRPSAIEYHRVFDTVAQTGQAHFVHGAAVETLEKDIVVCFAFNENAENSLSERLLYTVSSDCGASWSVPKDIAPKDGFAHSHGVLTRLGGQLWCFAPAFRGLGEPPVNAKGHRSIAFEDLRMEAYCFSGGSWQKRPCACGDFWPLNAPIKLENGALLISGCDGKWYAAAAVSTDKEYTRWEVVKPDSSDEIFTEAGAWAYGNEVLLLMRNETVLREGHYPAAVALSRDSGKSYAPCELSDLNIATTKPFCGRLGDGRPYALFNASITGAPRDRGILLLGVGNRQNPFSIDRLYTVDEGASAPSGRRLALAYPSACESSGRLYITYSYESTPALGRNNNDIMLAIVGIDSLAAD